MSSASAPASPPPPPPPPLPPTRFGFVDATHAALTARHARDGAIVGAAAPGGALVAAVLLMLVEFETVQQFLSTDKQAVEMIRSMQSQATAAMAAAAPPPAAGAKKCRKGDPLCSDL